MAGITRIHGGVGEEGVLNGYTGTLVGASLKFYDIVLAGATGPVNLVPEMGLPDSAYVTGVVEQVMRSVPSGVLAYYVTTATTGTVYLITDGHAAFKDTTGSAAQPGLQEIIRAMTGLATVTTSSMDISSSTVVVGTGFTVIP